MQCEDDNEEHDFLKSRDVGASVVGHQRMAGMDAEAQVQEDKEHRKWFVRVREACTRVRVLLAVCVILFVVVLVSWRRSNSSSEAESTQCKLPPKTKWCKAKITTPQPAKFWMAVTEEGGVGHSICVEGFWETTEFGVFGAPGHALDIGGNMGFYTFALAMSGWTVTTFEPMPSNLALLDATLCRNPELRSRIHLNRFALGASNEHCRIVSGFNNVDDGVLRCGNDPVPKDYIERASFNTQRLDDVLAEQKIPKVDLVKIDVECFHCKVFAGAPNFLRDYRPRIIQTEVCADNNPLNPGCGVSEYLSSNFLRLNYTLARDPECRIPTMLPRWHIGVEDFWLCSNVAN